MSRTDLSSSSNSELSYPNNTLSPTFIRAVFGSVSYEYVVALSEDAPLLEVEELLLELESELPLEAVLVVADEADEADEADDPEAPEAIASISEAVSQAVNKAAPAASNKNLFMRSPRLLILNV